VSGTAPPSWEEERPLARQASELHSTQSNTETLTLPSYDEVQIAELVRLLAPAPASWTTAAKELPRVRDQLERLLPMIERDQELRAEMTRDLERALERVGVDPEPSLINALRRYVATEGQAD
jgi:hypothetical protein